MKKQYRILTAVLALTLVNAMPAAAQDVTVLMQEMNDIREDLKILQRQMYNDGGSELVVTVGRLDELVRSTAGRLDELDYKIKQLDEKINLINKDIDVRMKLLEGKKITGTGGSVADNSPKFSAPVAKEAPQSIVGRQHQQRRTETDQKADRGRSLSEGTGGFEGFRLCRGGGKL